MSSPSVPLPAEIASRLVRAADLPRRGAALRAGDRLATGVAPLDALLDGGLPRGALVELAGRSGGRFALVLAALAAATSRGETAALLDLGDHLDPSSAEEAGCDLARLLWVRPRRFKDALLAAETVAAAGFRLVVLDAGLTLPPTRLRDAAPWLRLARAASPRRVAFLLSSPVPLAGLAAEALLQISARGLFRSAGSARFLAGAAARVSLLKVRGGRPAEAPLLALSPLAAPLAQRLLPELAPARPAPAALPAPARAVVGLPRAAMRTPSSASPAGASPRSPSSPLHLAAAASPPPALLPPRQAAVPLPTSASTLATCA